jgi:hypothetical protein
MAELLMTGCPVTLGFSVYANATRFLVVDTKEI